LGIFPVGRADAGVRRLEVEMSDSEGGTITGTADKDYNLLWFVERCLNNALRLEQYISDAEQGDDRELVDLFTRAQDASRRGAEEGKRLLATRLA
jgi:hypothetical protein